jgi:prophage regulatory protein
MRFRSVNREFITPDLPVPCVSNAFNRTHRTLDMPIPSNEIPSPRVLRLPDVINITQLSRSQIYRMEAEGKFPSRISLTQRTTAWIAQEVEEWLRERIALSRRAAL